MKRPDPVRPHPILLAVILAAAATGILADEAKAPVAEPPEPSPAPPLKGLVLWPHQAQAKKELSKAISLEFSYMTPSTLVRGADADGTPLYDWAPLEHLLDDIASRGHQAILRFRYEYPREQTPDYPGVPGATGVPRFIKDLPDYHETFSPNPGGDGPTWYADWSHPALRDFTMRFFADFAARYDRDPRIAFLEVGFGHWAEYHIYGTPEQLGKNFPSLEFQAQFLTSLNGWLRATPWIVSVDAANTNRAELSSAPALTALPFGLFDDTFMHARHEISQKGGGHNERCWQAFGPDRWRVGPCGGEISYYHKRDQREFLNPEGLYGVTWEQAAAKYHMTFVIANDSPSGPFATPKRYREAAQACGYDLRLVRVSVADGALEGEFANDGVAPLYHDVYPEAAGVRSETSLRGLLPGETRTFRIALPAQDSEAAQGLRLVSDKLLPGVTLPFFGAEAVLVEPKAELGGDKRRD